MSLDTVFVKMHTADPGAGGTANAAINATRKVLSVNEFMDGSGRLPQDAVIAYSGGEVTTTESYAWVSYWTAVTGGTWLGNEDIANQAATSAVALNIAVGVILVSDRNVIDYMARQEFATWRGGPQRIVAAWRGLFRANAYRLQQAKFARQNPQTI